MDFYFLCKTKTAADFCRLTFIEQTKTQKTVVLTMITTNGILQGDFADEIQYQITTNQLFS